MSFRFPSAEWTAAYKDAVNANARYRDHGKTWNHGPVAMVIEKDPTLGIPEPLGMVLDVHEGMCRATEYLPAEQASAKAPFVIVAPYDQWKKVIQGELEPIKAMMQGKLKLTKGPLPTMIRYVDASRELVESAAKVPTEFPR
jgi:putative sterol carrier protein